VELAFTSIVVIESETSIVIDGALVGAAATTGSGQDGAE
jgi:hypothetical protein